jgi:cell filamentation protein
MTGYGHAEDPYTDPQTGVLRNLLGITDQETLAWAETDLTDAKLTWLADNPIPGAYDLRHLQAFHRVVFGDIYEWAGDLRMVAISKTGTELFCLPQHIETVADEILNGLRNENRLRGLTRARFVDRLAHYLGEVNALHPFREGNGRTQRAFLNQLGEEAGWRLRWSRADSDENDAASRASLLGDPEPLRKMIGGIVEPS